jgi:hypothetical protein
VKGGGLGFLFWVAIAALMTIVTQIGGLVMLVTWAILAPFPKRRGLNAARSLFGVLVFTGLYLAATFFVVPPLANARGRVALPCFASSEVPLKPGNLFYCLANRRYATGELHTLAQSLAQAMDEQNPGTRTQYLDANFPFLRGFPLYPHLSHDDGRKLDIAYYYADQDGEYLPGRTASPIGYFAYEQPPEDAQPLCPPKFGSLRWDMAWLQPLWPDLQVDETRTGAALRWLVANGEVRGLTRIFIEPHMAERLGVSSDLIGFQGCDAARHDDHIHLNVG